MISRQWTGVFIAENAEEYMQHLRRDLFPKLSSINGYKGASILRRDCGETIEFLIVTNWESMDAIIQFAGDTPHLAVVPEEVQRMTLRFDKEVRHYEIAYSFPE